MIEFGEALLLLLLASTPVTIPLVVGWVVVRRLERSAVQDKQIALLLRDCRQIRGEVDAALANLDLRR